MKWSFIGLLVFPVLYAGTYTVSTNADSGAGSLRQAITDLNTNGDAAGNTITFNASIGTITITSADLPVIQKDVAISAPSNQVIDGNSLYRLFASVANLTISNCTIQHALAAGGNGANGSANSGAGGGGLGAGGGIYIDKGLTLTLSSTTITNNTAQGGNGGNGASGSGLTGGGGGGASFSITTSKSATGINGGGDKPGNGANGGTGTSLGTGYGGGSGGNAGGSIGTGGAGGGNQAGFAGSGTNGGAGGYFGGGGGAGGAGGGGGGNGGGNGVTTSSSPLAIGGGGGGIGSGGSGGNVPSGSSISAGGGGGGLGGGGGGGTGGTNNGGGGGGGFGAGGGGGGSPTPGIGGNGGLYGGNGATGSGGATGGGGGGGGAIGGGIFVGDSANLNIGDSVSIPAGTNALVAGSGGTGGAAVAQNGQTLGTDVFLFQKATLTFNGSSDLTASFSIAGVPSGSITSAEYDGGVVQAGLGTVTLSSTNTYSGGTQISSGILAVSSNANLGDTVGGITLKGGQLVITNSFASARTIAVTSDSALSVDASKTFSSSGIVSGGSTLYKEGSGTLSFTGAAANTLTGGITIQEGTVTNNFSGQLGSGTLTLDGGTLAPSGTFTDANPFSIGSSNGTIGVTSGTYTISGNVTGSGILTINGASTLKFSGNNSYSGKTNITAGTLQAGSTTGFSPNSLVSLANVASATLDLNNFSNTIGNLSGGGSIGGNVSLGSATLTVGDATSATYAGVISGTGGITKQGTGTLTLTGANLFTGITNDNAGTLVINGSIAGNINVGSSGTLKGSGTIGGNATVSGTIDPGTSSTTLSILGNLNYNSSALTQVEISPTQASLIAVTGAANLSGSFRAVDDPGTYSRITTYTVLTAGSVLSQFSSVISPLGFLDTLTYFPTSVVLTSKSLLVQIGEVEGENSLAIAKYLNAHYKNPLLQDFLVSIFDFTSEELNQMLVAISPARNAFNSFLSQVTMASCSNLLMSRLADERLFRRLREYSEAPFQISYTNHKSHHTWIKPSFGRTQVSLSSNRIQDRVPSRSSPTVEDIGKDSPTTLRHYMDLVNEDQKYTIWVDGFIEYLHQDAQHQTPAFNANVAGALLGIDSQHYENGMVGGAFGYALDHLHEKENMGHGSIQMYVASLYGMAYFGECYFEGALWGAYNQYHTERNINYTGYSGETRANYQGGQITPHIAIGYDINVKGSLLEPYLALDIPMNFEERYSEHGAGILDMQRGYATSALIRSIAGLNAYQAWELGRGVFALSETLSYVNQTPFKTGTTSAAIVGVGGAFTVETLTRTQNLFSPALELIYRMHSGPFFSCSYRGEFGSSYMTNEAFLKIGTYF